MADYFVFSKKFLNESNVKQVIFDYKKNEVEKVYIDFIERYKLTRFGDLILIETSLNVLNETIGEYHVRKIENINKLIKI